MLNFWFLLKTTDILLWESISRIDSILHRKIGLFFFTGTKLLEDQPIIISDKSGGTSFLRIVNSDNIYVEQQTLPKLVDNIRFTTTTNHAYTEIVKDSLPKKEEEKADSDRESLGR